MPTTIRISQGKLLAAVIMPLAFFAGCSGAKFGNMDIGLAGGAGMDLFKAVSLSDKEVQTMGFDSAKKLDTVNKVAPAGSRHSARLAKLTNKHKSEDGLKLDFRAYLVRDKNAFALPNGSVRVFSALMDSLTDEELMGIIGHEIGHVKLGHRKEKLRLAYATSAARKGVATQSNVAGSIAASQIGAIAEELINAQFSQSEELEADEYAYQFMKRNGYNPAALASAFRKMAKDGNGERSGLNKWLSTHPNLTDRAAKIEKKLNKS